jgi:hypothetical protein
MGGTGVALAYLGWGVIPTLGIMVVVATLLGFGVPALVDWVTR